MRMDWQPATIQEVQALVRADLAKCDDATVAAYQDYAIGPYYAPIVRYGKLENVVVVAQKNREVIYWEDVEEGFNVSPIANNGTIMEHHCNQDDLGTAFRRLA
jgi:hypothetical protein